MARPEELGISLEDLKTAGLFTLGGLVAYLSLRNRNLYKRYLKSEEARKLEPKTGLLNSEAFKEEVAKITGPISRETDQNRTHGLILLDIDDFKALNEKLTHPVVDEEALLPVADILRSSIRPDSDLVCRFGGEEFLVFLKDAHLQGVEAICHRIQYRANSVEPGAEPSNRVRITMVGKSFNQGEDFMSHIEDLSEALFEAKKAEGKNQIVILDDEPALAE